MCSSKIQFDKENEVQETSVSPQVQKFLSKSQTRLKFSEREHFNTPFSVIKPRSLTRVNKTCILSTSPTAFSPPLTKNHYNRSSEFMEPIKEVEQEDSLFPFQAIQQPNKQVPRKSLQLTKITSMLGTKKSFQQNFGTSRPRPKTLPKVHDFGPRRPKL